MKRAAVTHLTVKIPREVRFKFKYLCELNGFSVGEVVNQLIGGYIEENMGKQENPDPLTNQILNKEE